MAEYIAKGDHRFRSLQKWNVKVNVNEKLNPKVFSSKRIVISAWRPLYVYYQYKSQVNYKFLFVVD